MNIQRFTAATSREALAKARRAFGDDTLILANRPTENGVEVVATTEDSLATLGQGAFSGKRPSTTQRKPESMRFQEIASKVEEDADQLSMSTLSFQDYVRERMARKRHESAKDKTKSRSARELNSDRPVIVQSDRPKPEVQRSIPQAVRERAPVSQGISDELHAMKEMIEDRFNTLSWLGQARQNPVQAKLMLKLISAGYSPTLSRTILERMPEGADASPSLQWVVNVLERNLRTEAVSPALHEEGGTFALIGATGVGKTTTAAKLAGLCARRHGAGSVGLITLDTYRVGAQEQLRAYGKLLGIVAHLAHDRAALQDLLGLLSNKKMVLIDTTGLAPRDPRKREMLDLLELPHVKKLLVLNAGSHGDTLEDTVMGFKSPGPQPVIFSKTDEAVKLGPAIDVAIRHQLVLRGVTTGQRVPEDWEAPDAAKLVRASLSNAVSSPYDPKASDLGFIFSRSSAQPAAQEILHA
jgi:flagellar biosynthesis protein FlhF